MCALTRKLSGLLIINAEAIGFMEVCANSFLDLCWRGVILPGQHQGTASLVAQFGALL